MESNKEEFDFSKIQSLKDVCESIIYLFGQISKERFNTDLQECCNRCHNFKPQLIRKELYKEGITTYENYVSCEHREICKYVSSYIENEPKQQFTD